MNVYHKWKFKSVNKLHTLGRYPTPKICHHPEQIPPKKANNPLGYMLSLATWHYNSALSGTSTWIGLPKQDYYPSHLWVIIVGCHRSNQALVKECHPFLHVSFKAGIKIMIEEQVSHGGHIHLLLCLKLNLSRQSLFHGQGCIGEWIPYFKLHSTTKTSMKFY
jgi:hypothetical protein